MIAPGWRSNDCSSIDSATRSIAQFSKSVRPHCNLSLRAGAMRHAWICGVRPHNSLCVVVQDYLAVVPWFEEYRTMCRAWLLDTWRCLE